MHPRLEPLGERARGRWHGILPALGVPARALRNKHGPCPICGGRDRFRFDNKGGRGTWFCNQCGAGDGIELVKRLCGVEFSQAAKLIEQHIGEAPVQTAGKRNGSNEAAKRGEMAALWQRALPITAEDAAGRFLHRRTGMIEFPPCLRFAADERYADAGTKPSWHPALIAKVDPCDAAVEQGERAALHRTYLDQLGNKAEVATPRKMLGTMPTGAAVRLMPHADMLGIAEGIETALSASVLFNMPVWAALTANLLAEWVPPASVRTVFVFGDNDHSHTGQAAAYALAQRLKSRGVAAFVELPPITGQDWNDVLRQKQGEQP